MNKSAVLTLSRKYTVGLGAIVLIAFELPEAWNIAIVVCIILVFKFHRVLHHKYEIRDLFLGLSVVVLSYAKIFIAINSNAAC